MPNHFQALNERNPISAQPIPSLWPSIVVFACGALLAAGAMALIGGIALELLAYYFFPRRDKTPLIPPHQPTRSGSDCRARLLRCNVVQPTSRRRSTHPTQ